MPPPRLPRISWPLAGLLALAGVLRVGRALLRWDEVALAYAAYQAPIVETLGEPGRWVGTFVGLHPPLYGVIHAVLETVLPIPLVLLGFSALCSWLAVVLLARAGGALGGERGACAAAGLAGTGPVVLHYAAEVNDYPLLLLWVAAGCLAWVRYRQGRGGWLALAGIGVAATWTHVLGGLIAAWAVGGLALRHRGDAARASLFWAVGAAPVVAGAWALTGDSHTFGQPDLILSASLADWRSRFGLLCLPLAALALPGIRGTVHLAVLWAGLALSVAGLVAIGVAAPHQFPYWTLLMPPAVLLAARAAGRSRRIALGAAVLVAAQAAVALRDATQEGARLWADQTRTRAVDVALERARPGDALWLISPALRPDDDKRATSAVLWRIRPWHRLPMTRPFPLDYTDYRFGQPRRYGALVLYTFTDLWPARMDAILEHHTGGGHRTWIALYDHGPAHRYPQRLRRVLRPWHYREQRVGTDRGLGVDHLLVVDGPATESPAPLGAEGAP